MLVRQIVDDHLAQNAYLIGCQRTGEAIVIDPERDVDRYLALAAQEGLRLVAAADTHIHADFLSGVRELAAKVPDLRVYLSAEGGAAWTCQWPAADGIDAVFLRDGDVFHIGNIDLRAWHTPGHTPEHLAFVVTDRGGGADTPIGVATGDFLFVNDLGRPDLLESAVGVTGVMQSAARQLYATTRQLASLADHVQVWPGHGAGSACGKALGAIPTTTVGYERLVSPALRQAANGEEAFVAFILADQPEPPLYFAEMKRLNLVGAPILGCLPKPPHVSAEALVALAARPEVQVVDTRPDRHQFFAAHLPRSLHAPVGRAFPTVIGSMLDAGAPVVLIVDEGDLDTAIRDVIRIGYDHLVGWAPTATLETLRAAGQLTGTIPSIDVTAFERRLATHQPYVLDVRSAVEFAARHVPKTDNIAHTRLRSRLDALPTDTPIYVHCATGARAAASVGLLARHGFDVVHVDGASAAWQPPDPAR